MAGYLFLAVAVLVTCAVFGGVTWIISGWFGKRELRDIRQRIDARRDLR